MASPEQQKSHRPLTIMLVLLGTLVLVACLIGLYKYLWQSGVKGSVVVISGDCMPPAPEQCAGESQNTKKMTVLLYKQISKSADGTLTPSEKAGEQLNVTNVYSIKAKAGKYYIFYRYNDTDKEYCAPILNNISARQEPCEVTVPSTGFIVKNITFNLVTY